VAWKILCLTCVSGAFLLGPHPGRGLHVFLFPTWSFLGILPLQYQYICFDLTPIRTSFRTRTLSFSALFFKSKKGWFFCLLPQLHGISPFFPFYSFPLLSPKAFIFFLMNFTPPPSPFQEFGRGIFLDGGLLALWVFDLPSFSVTFTQVPGDVPWPILGDSLWRLVPRRLLPNFIGLYIRLRGLSTFLVCRAFSPKD